MLNTERGVKTGDLVTVPASYVVHGRERRKAVVESVSLDGERFTDTGGGRHRTGDAELVPFAATPELARTP